MKKKKKKNHKPTLRPQMSFFRIPNKGYGREWNAEFRSRSR